MRKYFRVHFRILYQPLVEVVSSSNNSCFCCRCKISIESVLTIGNFMAGRNMMISIPLLDDRRQHGLQRSTRTEFHYTFVVHRRIIAADSPHRSTGKLIGTLTIAVNFVVDAVVRVTVAKPSADRTIVRHLLLLTPDVNRYAPAGNNKYVDRLDF